MNRAASLPAIPAHASAQDALALLTRAGWREVGVGHCAWVFAAPDGDWVARVAPVDPAYRMFAEDCLYGPANRWLPKVVSITPLRREGYIVLMERLWPVDEAVASAFCAALGIKNESGFDAPSASAAFSEADDADFAALRARVLALLAKGAARYRLWGGADIKESCVMRNASGHLKLIDPLFLAGKRICEALLAGRKEDLADFSRAWLEDFLTMPVFQPGGDAGDGRAELVAALAQLRLER